MHILIAPNAFKNSLDAGKAAEAIYKGLKQSRLRFSATLFPVADGGDGTGALLIRHLHAKWIEVIVHNPLGRQVASGFGWIEEQQTAIIELADASGLRLLQPQEYNPLQATTFGTGELISKVLKMRAKKILVCIGGSATVDAGMGMLQALGLKFEDTKGNELTEPVALCQLSQLTGNLNVQSEIIVLCDVDNTLLGSAGSAAVFGPQKGASSEDVAMLEKCLTRFNDVVLQQTGKDMSTVKHGGAAGGIAAALNIFLNARLVNGIDYFLEITNFQAALENAGIVITGEGSLDEQTLHGKGPYGVAKKAKQSAVPVIGLAGKISGQEKLSHWFDQLIMIGDEKLPLQTRLDSTAVDLEKAAVVLGEELQSDSFMNR